MDAIEKRAREILGTYAKDSGYIVRESEAIAAIIAALTPPDLLPVHVVEEVVRALTIHGVAVPESKEEQVARGLQLVRLLCKQTPRQFTPPEGYVLVPVEPTEAMVAAAEEAYMPFGDMGFAISAALASAALAARPEVP